MKKRRVDPPKIKEALTQLRRAEDFIIIIQLPKSSPDIPDVHESRTKIVATARYTRTLEAKADMAHVLGKLGAYLYAQVGKLPASRIPSASLIVNDPNPPQRQPPGRQILSSLDWATENEYGDGPIFAIAQDVFADGEPIKTAQSSPYEKGVEYARAHFEEFVTWAREVAAVQIAHEMGWNLERVGEALSESLINLEKAFYASQDARLDDSPGGAAPSGPAALGRLDQPDGHQSGAAREDGAAADDGPRAVDLPEP